jgi:hypothetical protein
MRSDTDLLLDGTDRLNLDYAQLERTDAGVSWNFDCSHGVYYLPGPLSWDPTLAAACW